MVIFTVDDEKSMHITYDTILRMNGYQEIYSFVDPEKALKASAELKPSVILLDLMMGPFRGQDFIQPFVNQSPGVKVIIVSALDTIETAMECIRLGAVDYLVKPLQQERLLELLANIHQVKSDDKPKKVISETDRGMVYESKVMQNVMSQTEILAKTKLPILVTGETGTGKELMVNSIHELSGRSGELVKVNVAGFDEIMFSDSLFGHHKGAFTGAVQERKGLIQKAEEGTIFLDEIGDLDMRSQIKLLRLLQEGEYYPVGSDEVKKTNARFVMATHVNLAKKVEQGTFRQDLYYRLVSHRVHLPALRERREDIPVLAQSLLVRICKELNVPPRAIPDDLIESWKNDAFAGNIRELEGRVRQGVLFDFSNENQVEASHVNTNPISAGVPSLIREDESFLTLKEMTERLIDEAMSRAGGKQTEAAKLLGITQQALSSRLKKRSQAD